MSVNNLKSADNTTYRSQQAGKDPPGYGKQLKSSRKAGPGTGRRVQIDRWETTGKLHFLNYQSSQVTEKKVIEVTQNKGIAMSVRDETVNLNNLRSVDDTADLTERRCIWHCTKVCLLRREENIIQVLRLACFNTPTHQSLISRFPNLSNFYLASPSCLHLSW